MIESERDRDREKQCCYNFQIIDKNIRKGITFKLQNAYSEIVNDIPEYTL